MESDWNVRERENDDTQEMAQAGIEPGVLALRS